MADHKYIRREGSKGNYKYIYEEDLKNTKNYYNDHSNTRAGHKVTSGEVQGPPEVSKEYLEAYRANTKKNDYTPHIVPANNTPKQSTNNNHTFTLGPNGTTVPVKNTPQKKEAKNPFAGVGKAIGGFGKGVSNAASNVGKGVSNFAKEAKRQLSPTKTGDQKLGNGLSASHEVTVTGKGIKQPTKKISMDSNGTFTKVENSVSNVGKDISNATKSIGGKLSGGMKSLLKKESSSTEDGAKKQTSAKQKAQETRKKLPGEMDELVVNSGKKYCDQAIKRGLKLEDLDGLSLYDPNRVTVMDKKTANATDAEANASIASMVAYKRSTEEKAAAERLEQKFDRKYGSLLEENEKLVENADPRDVVVVSTLDYPNLKYVQREIRKNGTTGAIEKVHKSKLNDFNNMLKDYDTVLETQANAEHDEYLASLMGRKSEKHFYEDSRSYDDFREMEELKKMDAEDHRKAAKK